MNNLLRDSLITVCCVLLAVIVVPLLYIFLPIGYVLSRWADARQIRRFSHQAPVLPNPPAPRSV